MNKIVPEISYGDTYVDEACAYLSAPADWELWEQDFTSPCSSGSAGSNTSTTKSEVPTDPSGNESNNSPKLLVTVTEPPRFSFYKRPIKNVVPCAEITLADLYRMVTSDEAKATTEQLRALEDMEKAKEFKKLSFDYVTPAGIFTKREEAALVEPSGLMVIDIDDLKDADEVESVFQILLDNPQLETQLLFRSPGGLGLKWFVPIVNNEGHDHRFYFEAVSNYLKTLGIIVDPSGKDVSRACFIPFDPQAYIHPGGQEATNIDAEFNPEAWQMPTEKPEPARVKAETVTSTSSNDVTADVEFVLQQIEAKHIDITFDYDHWYRTGFALVDQFGEAGRSYFHRASQFYSGYSQEETDRQYDYCLRSKRDGVTIRTFFGYAQEAGIDIGTASDKSPQKVNGDNGETGNSGGNDRMRLPTFSDSILTRLPQFLQNVVKYGGDSPQETDAFLLGAIGVISACLPTLYGIYGGATVYANLFFFISARAASGKGHLKFCRNLVQPIHDREREKHKIAKEVYDKAMIKWEGTAKSNRGDKPKKPMQTMLFIAANNSATSFYQLLNENGERGILFEPEADALTNAFASDFGNYSDGFRRAFHHELISYHRRGGDEDVEVKCPRLSVVLTGTPQQIKSLIGNAENGLFSRFGFYRIESPLQWKDVLGEYQDVGLDVIFNGFGLAFLDFYDTLAEHPPIRFRVTELQRIQFNVYFSSLQEEYYSVFKDDIVGSVRRLGLICFRVAMVLSALRMWENGEMPEELICEDDDFDSALTICRTLAIHMARVFDELCSADFSKTAIVAKSAKRQRFLTVLPNEFGRQEYLDAAAKVGVPESTAEKWVKAFCAEDGPLERVEHGQYRKKS